MRAVHRFLVLLALLVCGSAGLAQAGNPAGSWAIYADGRVLAVLDLRRDASAPGGWAGAFIAPTHMGVTQSHAAYGIEGPTRHRKVLGAAERSGAIEFTIASSRPETAPDIFTFRLTAPDYAEFGWKDPGFVPMAVARVPAGTRPSSGWDAKRIYALSTPRPSNAEMAALFEADQADRTPGAAGVDWKLVGPRDDTRRARTLELVRAGALQSGDDFWHAAFILQHGKGAGDYLLAHSFALIAAARGRADAAWIAAATLDRYLQTIGQKQIYGTQFSMRPGQPATQEPYDRTLVSDALRAAMGVPPQAEQEKRRVEYDAATRAVPAPTPAPPKR
ncbi:MAG TPA: hypothetical protein VHM92_06995 [Allosphingosinicella sp.]|nr:hypothetical protein [Allosphingosinicella sp.]